MSHVILRNSAYLALALGFACALLLGVEADLVAVVSGDQPRHREIELDELLGLSGLFSMILAGLALLTSRIARRERRHRREIERTAGLDALTGIANRRRFFDRLHAALDRSREGRACAVILLDLDGFKVVNDTHGHAAGDRVLEQVARRLESHQGSNRLAARLGGDEFALLVEGDTATKAEIGALAERLRAAIAEPVAFAGASLRVGASIGVAFASEAGATPAGLLESADGAMYRVKRRNRDRLAA